MMDLGATRRLRVTIPRTVVRRARSAALELSLIPREGPTSRIGRPLRLPGR
jgi:hypothetical protein